MIAPPLNDTECLGPLTEVAARGTERPDVQALAERFPTTAALAAWLRSLPQRDDTGDAADGPRVACDVSQRARLVAEDPNCVERAILYLAAAELIDPAPTRQLATVDVSRSVRHTFPVESGEPVVLDPDLRRNAVRAALWRLRNGSGGASQLGEPVDLAPIVEWLLDLAEVEADDRGDQLALARIERARRAIRRMVRGGPVTVAERADVLYALRLGGQAAPDFGRAATDAYELARAVLARLVTRPRARRQAVRIEPERAVYWGGKAIATYLGAGGLYDVAHGEVRRATSPRRRRPRPRPENPRPAVSVPAVRSETKTAGPSPAPAPSDTAPPQVAAGPSTELDEGSQGEEAS